MYDKKGRMNKTFAKIKPLREMYSQFLWCSFAKWFSHQNTVSVIGTLLVKYFISVL